MTKLPPKLQDELDRLYRKAIDPNTTDNYASHLRKTARQLCLTAGVPREKWPHWTEEGSPWQARGDRTEEVKYPPGLSRDVIVELERLREKNHPAEARALCRRLNISPPPWARR